MLRKRTQPGRLPAPTRPQALTDPRRDFRRLAGRVVGPSGARGASAGLSSGETVAPPLLQVLQAPPIVDRYLLLLMGLFRGQEKCDCDESGRQRGATGAPPSLGPAKAAGKHRFALQGSATRVGQVPRAFRVLRTLACCAALPCRDQGLLLIAHRSDNVVGRTPVEQGGGHSFLQEWCVLLLAGGHLGGAHRSHTPTDSVGHAAQPRACLMWSAPSGSCAPCTPAALQAAQHRRRVHGMMGSDRSLPIPACRLPPRRRRPPCLSACLVRVSCAHTSTPASLP